MSFESFPASKTEKELKGEKIRIEGEDIEVFDVRPAKEKTDVPTVVLSGWITPPQTFDKNIQALAEAGRRVIAADAPHGVNVKEYRSRGVPEVEMRKVEALVKTLEAKNILKADLVGHSEGGLVAVLAASLYPDKFRNLVLVDPSGIIGKDNLAHLSVRFTKDFLRQRKRIEKEEELAGAVKNLLRRSQLPLLKSPRRALGEVTAISQADIRHLLENLKQKGIGISIIHAVDDQAFPMERVQQMVNTKQVDGFYSVQGTHNEILLHPEKYSKLVDQALDALEHKSDNKDDGG